MTLQAIRSIYEAPVIAALGALTPAVSCYGDNQTYTDDDATTEYALIRVNFTGTTEVNLGASLENLRGVVIVECFTPKNIGPARAQEMITSVMTALNNLNTCNPHPSTGSYGRVGEINGPNFAALSDKPHYMASISCPFKATHLSQNLIKYEPPCTNNAPAVVSTLFQRARPIPVSCSSQVLTGTDGSVWFQPASTEFCLKDYSDFPAGTSITVPSDHDFRVNDPVKFTAQGTGHIDANLTAGTTYYVVAKTATTIDVSASAGGTAITLAGDGGTGSADTGNTSVNHIKIDYAEFAAICQVKSFSIDLSREEIDTTVLPCAVNTTGSLASFRTMQAGFASGSGSMEVQFTDDQTNLANRLLGNSMRRNQDGAEVRLFINTVGTTADPSLTDSLYIQAPISIMGFSLNVTPEDVIVGSLTFSLSGQPTHLLGN